VYNDILGKKRSVILRDNPHVHYLLENEKIKRIPPELNKNFTKNLMKNGWIEWK